MFVYIHIYTYDFGGGLVFVKPGGLQLSTSSTVAKLPAIMGFSGCLGYEPP